MEVTINGIPTTVFIYLPIATYLRSRCRIVHMTLGGWARFDDSGMLKFPVFFYFDVNAANSWTSIFFICLGPLKCPLSLRTCNNTFGFLWQGREDFFLHSFCFGQYFDDFLLITT